VQWHDCNVRQEHAGPAEEAGEDDPGGPGRPEQGAPGRATAVSQLQRPAVALRLAGEDGERDVHAGAQGLHRAVPARAARRRGPRAAARGRDLVPSARRRAGHLRRGRRRASHGCWWS
jgi:hypothetical protein